MVYLSLFTAAFLAATIVPFYSEFALAGAQLAGHNSALIWLVATAGNTLGSVVNWLLGLGIEKYKDRRWFPFKPEQIERAQRWFQRFGIWSLLLAWAPVGGDALTLVAGIMRVRFLPFLLLVAAGKGARYAVVLWLVDGAAG